MKRVEAGGMKLTVKGNLRYHRHRKAVFAHVDPFIESIKELYSKGEQTPEGANKAQAEALESINGEEVELLLPPPIPESDIIEIPSTTPDDFFAMSKLTDLVLGQPEEPKPA